MYAVINIQTLGALRIKIIIQQSIHALTCFVEIDMMHARSFAETTKEAYEMPKGDQSRALLSTFYTLP